MAVTALPDLFRNQAGVFSKRLFLKPDLWLFSRVLSPTLFAIDWKNTEFFGLESGETQDQVWTVGDLTARIRRQLESSFSSLAVRGEISNLRRQASGHVYFTLKDDRSQIPAVLFQGHARRVRLDLADGMEVVCLGNLSVYEPRGAYQLLVRDVLEEGRGRLQRAFEALKAKLSEEGLFAVERKRELPGFPRTVGIVTSPTGAALQDFVRILERRGFRGRVVVIPALVQGSTAAASLVEALNEAAEVPDLDVVVIGRGGGSLEDLWPFNEEPVVRAVAAFPKPIVSAVGHEIDFALTDFAADVRAETPSGAAELISSLWLETVRRLLVGRESLVELTEEQFKRKGLDLDFVQVRLQALSPGLVVQRMRQRVNRLAERLGTGMREAWWERASTVAARARSLERHYPAHRLELLRQRLRSLEGRLQQSSVEATLRRGFALVRNEKGEAVLSGEGLRDGQRLGIQFRDGEVPARVEGNR